VVELVDTLALGASIARCEGSSPFIRTKDTLFWLSQRYIKKKLMKSENFIEDEKIIEAVKSSINMAEASVKCGLSFSTFVRRATKLGIYAPNKGRKGIKRDPSEYDKLSFKLENILEGKHPQYSTYKLKLRLFKEGIKKDECEVCFTSEWLGNKLNCELHHKDGNRTNHKLENLQVICPNCHSQTDTFSRHRKNNQKE
jgi:hypothetical protein